MFSRLSLLVLLTLFTRFFGLNWGGGFFFQPDENNMVNAVFQMSHQNYNPHFFAYGQFPLYLAFFSEKVFSLPHTIPTITYILRFWSAVFSSISVYYFYKLAQKTLPKKSVLLSTIIYIFLPGLIQLAHFGTTESLLVLIFLMNLNFSLDIIRNPLSIKSYLIVSLVTGIGLASKLSSLIFLVPVLMASTYNFFKLRTKLRISFLTIYTVLFIIIFSIVFSPYNIIKRTDFLSALKYETGVATGTMPVFYTTQFRGTSPYLFQFEKVFPFGMSLAVTLFSLVGIILVLIKNKNMSWAIVTLSSIVYIAYFGQLYVKWFRFMSPVFFIGALLSATAITSIKNRYIIIFLTILSIFPGLFFMRLYAVPDIRIVASDWMVKTLPDNTKILSEGGNVINLPLVDHNLDITNFDFYTLENDPQSLKLLASKINQAEYIIVPSRRVFKNQTGADFPTSHNYYTALFGGELGFQNIKQFSYSTNLLLNQENAEETWTVFDHPTIRIFKKNNQLSLNEYEKILKK